MNCAESAPFHLGSLSGKSCPMSGIPAFVFVVFVPIQCLGGPSAPLLRGRLFWESIELGDHLQASLPAVRTHARTDGPQDRVRHAVVQGVPIGVRGAALLELDLDAADHEGQA